MSLMPKSLGGRLSLLLLGVLLVAQMLSAALHFRDRGEALMHATGFNSAQRIAGIVRVLDQLTSKQRDMVVAELDLPPLRLRLSDDLQVLPSHGRASARARLFHQLLHLRLGRDRPISLYMPENPTSENNALHQMWGGMPSMGDAMQAMLMQHTGTPPAGYSFIVQVELAGGQWAVFGYHLPDELAAWPWDLLVGLLILLAAVFSVSFFAVRWLTRPLSLLANAADQLGKDISHQPLPEQGPAEVRRAARAFNRMQRRLARFVEERTRILAAVSHDLKTPITRMRLRTRKIEDEAVREKFESDLQDMQMLVQSSLEFMRGMALKEETAPIDVNALIDSLAEDAREAGAEITVIGVAASAYTGKPLALKRCLGNLLDNGVRYGGKVQIQLEDTAEQLMIIIADYGPGLPENMLERVMEPFVRGEPSRNNETGGTGLGLSIARNIARSHGGELVLENAQAGGLKAVLALPR